MAGRDDARPWTHGLEGPTVCTFRQAATAADIWQRLSGLIACCDFGRQAQLASRLKVGVLVGTVWATGCQLDTLERTVVKSVLT